MKSCIPFLLSVLWIGPALAAGDPAGVPELFGPPDNLLLVRDSDAVDACILRHIEPKPRPDGSVDWSTESYKETAFVSVDPGTSSVLRYLLLNEQTYDWKASKGGHQPKFYVRLRFHRSQEFLAIDFCFVCRVLRITREGAQLGQANFNGNADLLILAFQKIFPADEPLKRLAKEAGLPP